MKTEESILAGIEIAAAANSSEADEPRASDEEAEYPDTAQTEDRPEDAAAETNPQEVEDDRVADEPQDDTAELSDVDGAVIDLDGTVEVAPESTRLSETDEGVAQEGAKKPLQQVVASRDPSVEPTRAPDASAQETETATKDVATRPEGIDNPDEAPIAQRANATPHAEPTEARQDARRDTSPQIEQKLSTFLPPKQRPSSAEAA